MIERTFLPSVSNAQAISRASSLLKASRNTAVPLAARKRTSQRIRVPSFGGTIALLGHTSRVACGHVHWHGGNDRPAAATGDGQRDEAQGCCEAAHQEQSPCT